MIVRFIFILLFVLQPDLAVSAEESECGSLEDLDSASTPEDKRAYFEQQFTAAERHRQTAAEAGAEWLETEGLLFRAQEEAASGNWNLAARLTAKACKQAELALQQAEYESQAWKNRVVD